MSYFFPTSWRKWQLSCLILAPVVDHTQLHLTNGGSISAALPSGWHQPERSPDSWAALKHMLDRWHVGKNLAARKKKRFVFHVSPPPILWTIQTVTSYNQNKVSSKEIAPVSQQCMAQYRWRCFLSLRVIWLILIKIPLFWLYTWPWIGFSPAPILVLLCIEKLQKISKNNALTWRKAGEIVWGLVVVVVGCSSPHNLLYQLKYSTTKK